MSWDIGSLLAKAFTLMAMVSVVGGILCLYLCLQSDIKVSRFLVRYIKIGALIGVIVSGLYFFVQVGSFSQSGLGGMLDITMMSILAQSALGYASLSRVLAFFLVLSFVFYMQRASRKEAEGFGIFPTMGLVGAGALLAYSFSLIGHVAELGRLAGIAIGLHILAIAFWVGSLIPLWHLCMVEDLVNLQKIMRRFGELAISFLVVLIFSGIYLLTQLFVSPDELINSNYGLTLLFKLTVVLALLLLGALNKFKFVPGLNNVNGVVSLKRSITLEITLAFLILMITAYLTTLVGISRTG